MLFLQFHNSGKNATVLYYWLLALMLLQELVDWEREQGQCTFLCFLAQIYLQVLHTSVGLARIVYTHRIRPYVW
jgi:hypothetical protein